MLFKSLGSIVNQSQTPSITYSSSEDTSSVPFSKSPVPSSSPLSSSYGSNTTSHTARQTSTMVFSRPYWSTTNGF